MGYYPGMLIDELPLSVRARNSLRRSNITTVLELMQLDDDAMLRIRSLGKTTFHELKSVILALQEGSLEFGEPVSRKEEQQGERIAIQFINEEGITMEDIDIRDLDLSFRSTNQLLRNGVEYASQLVNMTEEELLSIRNLGVGSVREIINKIKDIKFKEYFENSAETEETEGGQADVRNAIVSIVFEDFKDHCNLSLAPNLKINLIEVIFNPELELDEAIPHEMIDLNYILQVPHLLERIFQNEAVYQLLKTKVLTVIKANSTAINIFSLKQHLPELARNHTVLDAILEDLNRENLLEFMPQGLRARLMTLDEFIESIENHRKKEVLRRRLSGMTLEEVGTEFQVVRERIRQLEQAALKKRPKLREDDYKAIFEQYQFTESEFMEIFQERKETFQYLKIAYKKGSRDLTEFAEDDSMPAEARVAAKKILGKGYLVIPPDRIRVARTELMKYVLKIYCRDEVSVDDYIKFYNDFLKDNNLDNRHNLQVQVKAGLENQLNENQFILWKYGKRFRYYNSSDYDFSEFFETIDLDQYKDVEYSALKFFRDYPELMLQYDIRDEYELHNLLKKLYRDKPDSGITFERMPVIVFGNADREAQVYQLFLEHAPIPAKDLAELYDKEYGVKVETVLANYFKHIDVYYHKGIYSINFESMNEEEYQYMSSVMDQDLYYIADAKALFLKQFPDGDAAKINSMNFKKLGFRVADKWIVSDRYLSFDQYFKDRMLQDDVLDLDLLDPRLNQYQTFRAGLYQLKEQFQLIEFTHNKFIKLSRLEEKGVTIDRLKGYIAAVLEFAQDRFFTVHSLKEQGFVHELHDLGFEDLFYASLLKNSKELSKTNVSGGVLFQRSTEPIKQELFFEYLLTTRRKVDLNDFLVEIKVEYGLLLDRTRTIAIIRDSTMHYDDIMDKVYIDYDEYYEEI